MLSLPLRVISYIGRHATIAYALSMVLGLALPQLAALLRPAIPISIFLFIVLAFARANLPGLKRVISNPGRLSLSLGISSIIPPLIGWAFLVSPLGMGLDPALRLAIALMAAAPPLMASPVYAGLLGLEASLALTTLVMGMAIAPLTSPLLASALAGAHVPISQLELAQRLALFIGLGMIFGLVLRQIAGVARISAWKEVLDGLGVLMYFLFAVAAMDGVIDAAIANPMLIITILALSTSLSTISFAAGYIAMGGFSFNDRFSVSISTGLRNMGLLIVPIISIVPPKTFLYFALAQVPIYVAPMILKATKNWLEPRP